MFNTLPIKQLMIAGGDIILILVSFYLAPVIQYGTISNPLYFFGTFNILAVVIYLLTFYVFDFYNLEEPRNSRYFIRFFLAAVVALVIASAIYFMFHVHTGSQNLIISSIIICLLLLSERYWFDGLSNHPQRKLRILIIGAGQTGLTLYEMLTKNKDFEIMGFLDDNNKKWGASVGQATVIGGTSLLSTLVNDLRIDKVIIAIQREMQSEVYKWLVEAKFHGVEVYELPSFYEKIAAKLPVLHMNEMWLGYADIYGVKSNLYNAKVKKIFDKSLALIALIIVFPFLCVIALLIKIDSRGSIFYRQKRVGFNGVIFDLVKFRSMVDGAEKNGAVWAQKNDQRVTRIGSIMRLLRIDELPQLWNVLKGDLSLVGPRPERPEFVDYLIKEIPYYSLRHSVKPGITGWAQINYPYGASKEDSLEKLQYDLYYIKNLTFLLDLYILLRTIRTVLLQDGAR